MWNRGAEGKEPTLADADPSLLESSCRRSYYRVSGFLPVRLTRLTENEIDSAVFDLSLPDPLLAPIEDGKEDAPLMARLRRIEEKLDLLLGASQVEMPSPLSGADRQSVVFSGSGLSLDVTWAFRKSDAYRVEVLLPSPYSRVIRAVANAVADSDPQVLGDGLRPLAVELRHMESEDRDALIAFSYDLQRVALRARADDDAESVAGLID